MAGFCGTHAVGQYGPTLERPTVFRTEPTPASTGLTDDFPRDEIRSCTRAQANLETPNFDLDTGPGLSGHARLGSPPGHPLKPPDGFSADFPDPAVADNAQRHACGGQLELNGFLHPWILGPRPDGAGYVGPQ